MQNNKEIIRIKEIKVKKDQEKVETARRKFLKEIDKWYSQK